jgi:hypothetical protein
MPNITTAPWAIHYRWAHNWGNLLTSPDLWEQVDNADLDAEGPNGRATRGVMTNPRLHDNGDTSFNALFLPGTQRRSLAREKTRELLAYFIVYVVNHAKPCGECRMAFRSVSFVP